MYKVATLIFFLKKLSLQTFKHQIFKNKYLLTNGLCRVSPRSTSRIRSRPKPNWPGESANGEIVVSGPFVAKIGVSKRVGEPFDTKIGVVD